MILAAVKHRPTLDYIYPKNREELSIKIETSSNDIKEITLVWWFRYETDPNKLRKVSMNKILQDSYTDYYHNVINTNELAAYVRYYFVLDDGNRKVSYGSQGFVDNEPEFNENFFEFLWPNEADGNKAPDWSNNQIYYQIFPERFKNGNDNLTPKNADKWGSEPTRENFMGGDLKGIIDSLDYIKDLGATCIYLTPIFKAPSNHKYDTVDYYEINESFGNKDDLRTLVNEVHLRNMRILLDGVFNHCGYCWPRFQDVVNNGEKSEYKNWFFINSYPVSLDEKNYDCVGHYKWMPKINLENPDTAEYFIKVGEYWIENFNIDGWRLDVADEIPASFWQKFSARIKQLNKDVILLGETWGDAGKLVTSNRLDTAMNYLFKDSVVAWIGKQSIKPSKFDHLVNRMYSLYPEEIIHRLYNPLDSHDTARFMHECKNDIKRFKLAVAIQMCMPGCPAIFYGDEIGLSGDNDPSCRLCMNWDETSQNKDLFNWYKELIVLRKNTPALYKGDYHSQLVDDENNCYAFTRSYKDQSVMVVINAGSKECNLQIPTNIRGWKVAFKDCYITEDAYKVCISMPAYSVHILKKEGVLNEKD